MFVPVFLVFVGLAGLALWMGYLAYLGRRARETAPGGKERAAMEAAAADHAVDELARIHREMRETLASGRRAVESMRQSLSQGLKG